MKIESAYPEIKDWAALFKACATLKELVVCGNFTTAEQGQIRENIKEKDPELALTFVSSEARTRQWLREKTMQRPIVLFVPDSFHNRAPLQKLQTLFYDEDVYTIGQISKKILVGSITIPTR